MLNLEREPLQFLIEKHLFLSTANFSDSQQIDSLSVLTFKLKKETYNKCKSMNLLTKIIKEKIYWGRLANEI
jgi:hypothetical protein